MAGGVDGATPRIGIGFHPLSLTTTTRIFTNTPGALFLSTPWTKTIKARLLAPLSPRARLLHQAQYYSFGSGSWPITLMTQH